MIERRIKELSIAVETLSRVNTHAAYMAMTSIEALLKDLVKEAQKETITNPPHPTRIPNDDIPF